MYQGYDSFVSAEAHCTYSSVCFLILLGEASKNFEVGVPRYIEEVGTSLKLVWVSGTNSTQFGYRNFGITVWVLAVGFLISCACGVWRGSLARVL